MNKAPGLPLSDLFRNRSEWDEVGASEAQQPECARVSGDCGCRIMQDSLHQAGHEKCLLSKFVSRFQLQLPQVVQHGSSNPRQAAVLIPIICRPEPTLLLTRRADTLRKHPGQIAFPGGVADPADDSLVTTALREAQEEVAIPPLSVTVLGQLMPLDSSSGYRITPVVGLIPSGIPFYGNQAEVSDLFEIPLQEALTLSRYYPLDIYHAGTHHQIYFSWYDGQFIWGLTAAIIRQLAQQVTR